MSLFCDKLWSRLFPTDIEGEPAAAFGSPYEGSGSVSAYVSYPNQEGFEIEEPTIVWQKVGGVYPLNSCFKNKQV